MIKSKYNLSFTLGNNLRRSFDGNSKSRHRVTLSLENKIRNLTMHHKTLSVTKDTPKKQNKRVITLSNTNNLFHNIPNYIPLPNGLIKNKNFPCSSKQNNVNLIQSNSVKTMNNTIANHNKNISKKFHTISLTTSSSSSNIIKKENAQWLNTESTQSTDDSRNIIDKLQKENKYYKEKIESQKKFYEYRIKELNEEIFNINEKNRSVMKNYNKAKEENDQYKMKEMKLMKIIYMIKKQGIEINEIINDVMNEDQCLTETNRSTMSLTSINFQDKVKVESNIIKGEDKVPFLDLKRIPSYESEEEDDEEDNTYVLPKKNNYFNK